MDVFELVSFAPPADPLSETTRNERRSLLAANLVALALTAGGLIPSKVSALGVDFDATKQFGFLSLLLLVVLYYLAAFLVYGLPEWRRSQAADELFRQRLAEFVGPFVDKAKDLTKAEDHGYAALQEMYTAGRHAKLASQYRFGRAPRVLFDFGLPLAVTAWSVALLLGAILERQVATTSGWQSPGVWVAIVSTVALAVWGAVTRWQRWKEAAPARAIRRQSEELQQLTDVMRRASALPEGSPERDQAKREVEEALKHFTLRTQQRRRK